MGESIQRDTHTPLWTLVQLVPRWSWTNALHWRRRHNFCRSRSSQQDACPRALPVVDLTPPTPHPTSTFPDNDLAPDRQWPLSSSHAIVRGSRFNELGGLLFEDLREWMLLLLLLNTMAAREEPVDDKDLKWRCRATSMSWLQEFTSQFSQNSSKCLCLFGK